MRIDSHHHFWVYDPVEYAWISDQMSVLKRDFLPPDLAHAIHAAGVQAVVSVQARQSLAETHWLLQLADQTPFVAGVVGWVPLASDTLPAELEALASQPLLKGVRHVVQDEPDDHFVLGAAFNRGIERLKSFGLVYDILIYARQLSATIELVDRHPEQPFVVDHLAKPTIMSSAADPVWERQLRELGRREHVACKFSGVVTEVRGETWNVDLLRPYWRVALEAFGAERLMFGSDWPVCLVRTEYGRWVDAVSELAGELSAAEQAAFWGGNAARIYGLTRWAAP